MTKMLKTCTEEMFLFTKYWTKGEICSEIDAGRNTNKLDGYNTDMLAVLVECST